MLLKELLSTLDKEVVVKISTPTTLIYDPEYDRNLISYVCEYLDNRVTDIKLERLNANQFYLNVGIEEYSDEKRRQIYWNS